MNLQNNSPTLPKDLAECENYMLKSVKDCLETNSIRRLSVNLKFEGLKIVPIAIRLINKLDERKITSSIAFSDYGSSALAKRDYPSI